MNKLITGLSALQFFQVFRYASLLLSGIIFAKAQLPLGAIGNYETLLFIASLVSTFWVSGIIKAMLSQYNRKVNDLARSPFFFNVFLFSCFISLLFFFLLKTLGPALANQLSDSGYLPYFDLIPWYVLLSCPTYLIEYILLLKNKPRLIILYGIGTSLLQLIAVTLPIILGYHLFYSLCGLLIVSAIKLILLFICLKHYSTFKIDSVFLGEHMRLAFPLIVSNLISSSAEFIDSFIISTHYNNASFAIFRYGAREFPLTLLLATTFSNAMVPEVANSSDLETTLKNIKDKSLQLIYILYPLTILLILSSHYLYPLVFNIQFSESASIFNTYLLLIVSRLLFPQTILIGLKKAHYLVWISLIELVINAILSFIFVRYWGMMGVALGTVIAYLMEKLILITLLKMKYDISPSFYIPIRLIMGFLILTILAFTYVENFL